MISFIVLPKPFAYSSAAYISFLLIYNAYGSYIDAKIYLTKYRQNKLLPNEKNIIKSEWDAVKYGAHVNCVERLWDSITWPITLTNNIIPFMVLTFNAQ
jgi:hypothetical protein